MRRILLVVCCCSIVLAGWVTFTKSAVGNVTGSIIRGTAADTWFLSTATIAGVTNLLVMVYADSVVDSLPKFTCKLQFKSGYTGAAWVDINGVAGADSIMPLAAWVTDTLTGGRAAIGHWTMFWSRPGDSSRVVLTGLRAAQCAKNCSIGLRAWRE